MSTTTTPGGSAHSGSAGTTEKLEGAAGDAKQAATEAARNLGREGSAAYREGASRAREAASSAASGIRSEASNLAEGAADKAKSLAEDQKNAGAERLSSVAGAVNRAADDLEEASPNTAHLIRKAAARVEHFSSDIRKRSVEDLLESAHYYARQQPLAVFGGAVVAGLLLSRFLKSTAEPDPRSYGGGRSFDDDDRGYGGGRQLGGSRYAGTSVGTPRDDIGTLDRDRATGDRVDPATGEDPLSAAQPQPANFGTVSGGTRDGI
jgi:ElaB/YqjD/DUF883 family membrane-anchored ribosome-binding protein